MKMFWWLLILALVIGCHGADEAADQSPASMARGEQATFEGKPLACRIEWGLCCKPQEASAPAPQPVSIKLRTERAKILLGFNSVGGESATRVASALAQGGKMITFGAMSRQPLKLPTGLLIFKDLQILGFWLTRWYEKATEADKRAMFAELFELAKTGAFKTPIERIYPVEEIRQAVTHALQGSRGGKVLIGKA